MKIMKTNTVRSILVALAMFACAGGANAQLFGQQRNEDSDTVARMSRLENQIRQLTGMVEELQYKNNQLEQQLKRVQQDTDFRFQEMSPPPRGGQRGQAPAPQPQPAIPPAPRGQAGVPPQGLPPVATPRQEASMPPSQGRRDVFDPSSAPDAPGVPRQLGTLGGAPEQPRGPGAPLDLGAPQGGVPTPGRPGQPVPPSGAPVGQQAVLAPSGSARDEYDLAYGAVLRRDYSLAIDGFRTFLANHGESRMPDAQRLVPEAHYWLGESQYQMKQFKDAAETFLEIYNEYPNAVKAPDALLRLGQSLAELGERDTACATLGQVLTKYPKSSPNVRRSVEQEQKRARC
jgi:tol-pal system protein YbgF